MATKRNDAFTQKNLSRREPYPLMDRNFSYQINYNFNNSPSQKAYSNRNIPFLAERPGYPEYLYRGERFRINHPYFEPKRFSLRRDISATPFHPVYSNYNNRAPRYQAHKSNNEGSHSFQGKAYTDEIWNVKNSNEGVHPPKDDSFAKIEEVPIKLEENAEHPTRDESESWVVNYCLDRQTQHTIHRLQNDFRLTRKYKTFVMYEMPLIVDFKPTPSTTANKFHDRFKCLFKQLLDFDVKDCNIDTINLDLENPPPGKHEVVENVEVKETKE